MKLKQRWISKVGERGTNQKIDEFLNDVFMVCRKHKMAISHEDGHGAFRIVKFNKDTIEWLAYAHDCVTEKEN